MRGANDGGRAAGAAVRGRRQALAVAVVVARVSSWSSPAFAEPDSSTTPAPAAPPARHRELNLVPIAGGDSDIGAGVGEIGDWAAIGPGCSVYCWRLESSAFISFKIRDGQVIIPFQDYFGVWTLPAVGPDGRLRLDVRPAFTDETTLNFYGIGNQTPFPANTSLPDREYGRMHPSLSGELRARIVPHWFLQVGNVYTVNRLTVRPTSLLAQEQTAGPPDVRALLGGFATHGVELIELGVEYDSRDNEIVTTRGMFHALQLRISPRMGSFTPYAYEQIDATSRFYLTPVPRWLTLSWRVVADVLLGDPPFYEMARFDDTPAIGGGKAVRGIPAQRYYGKVKVFQNFEVRSELYPFTLGKKRLVLGAAAFFDAGRSWTELTRAHPDLDGTGIGLKYGTGVGLRLQEGTTFVVRADLAWSPDARPIGAYFAAGQIF